MLTFDDGPASHATVVAPILKRLGSGATFYVCNFDSFKTLKDWYLTYRQMVAMDADGFEIGNHTYGHGGGLENYLRMEDEVVAHHGPKMTTVCWPIYNVVWPICPDLAARGYTFGRGGHEHPYRPTVDNPFDVPSFSVTDGLPIENFIKHVQQACQGRVVVLILAIATERSLGPNPEITIASGATLELNFEGQMNIHTLTLDGKHQPPGVYSSANATDSIRGAGTLSVMP